MDLKDFQKVNEGEEKGKQILSEVDHDDSDKILSELEARIAKINGSAVAATPAESKETDLADNSTEAEFTSTMSERQKTIEEAEIEERKKMSDVDETFLDKIRPFILPIFLTVFALIFSGIFMYFFSQSRIKESVNAITNNNNQPEVIIIKETKPEVKPEVVVIEEPVEEPEPEPVVATPTKAIFEDGITTVMKVRFSFDKYIYDNHPRGIYLLAEQEFEGEYEDFKLIASNRAFANDFFFGINRYMVSLVGDCQYTVPEAEILVKNVVKGKKNLAQIGDDYFTGEVVKVIDSVKPKIVCNQ